MGKFEFSAPFHALFCGNPGVGKSKLIGSAFTGSSGDDRLTPLLMIEIENKINSITSKIAQTVSMEELASPDFELSYDGINLMQHLTFSEIKKVITMFERGDGCTSKVKTLVMDSLTELDNKLNIDFTQFKNDSKDDSIRKNGFYVYNEVTNTILPLITRIKDISDLNFIGTAHAKKVTDKDNAITGLVPMFTGNNLPINIAGKFPMVAYLTVPLDKVDRDYNKREVIFRESNRKKGLEYIKNQYENNTLGEYILYEDGEPILPMILDGCLIPHPVKTTTNKKTKE